MPPALFPGRTLVPVLGPLLVLVTGLALCLWTWMIWPDVVVDFGRELYVPWQLYAGQQLYGEIAYFNGPLSPHINLLWFLLLGPSLRSLAIGNLLLLAVLSALLYYLVRAACGSGSATVTTLVFLLLFAFAQYVGIGNYNYICPYSHEVTHGLLLSTVGFTLLWHGDRWRPLVLLVLSGLALGLIFLTKAEIFLAAAGSLLVGWAGLLHGRGYRRARLWLQLLLFVLASLLPPLVAVLLLARSLPWAVALQGTVGSLSFLLRTKVASTPFYLHQAGLDQLGHNLLQLTLTLGGWALLLVPLVGLSRLLAPREAGLQVQDHWWTTWLPLHRRGWIPWLLGLTVSGALFFLLQPQQWFDVPRPLPLFLAGLIAVVIRHLRRPSVSPEQRRRHVWFLSLLLFSGLLLLKILWRVRLYQYGVFLAMPGLLLLVVLFVHIIPRLLTARGHNGQLFRVVMLIVLGTFCCVHLRRTAHWRALKQTPVGRGADQLLADDRGRWIETARQEITQRTGPQSTLIALPQGVMLNVLTRRKNPSAYYAFLPVELELFGQQRILADLRRHSPDLIALVHADTSEYGPRFFGRDYARPIMDWIEEQYYPVLQLGAVPLQDERFGILLLRRR